LRADVGGLYSGQGAVFMGKGVFSILFSLKAVETLNIFPYFPYLMVEKWLYNKNRQISMAAYSLKTTA